MFKNATQLTEKEKREKKKRNSLRKICGVNELERKSRIFHSDTNDILTVTSLTSNQPSNQPANCLLQQQLQNTLRCKFVIELNKLFTNICCLNLSLMAFLLKEMQKLFKKFFLLNYVKMFE